MRNNQVEGGEEPKTIKKEGMREVRARRRIIKRR